MRVTVRRRSPTSTKSSMKAAPDGTGLFLCPKFEFSFKTLPTKAGSLFFQDSTSGLMLSRLPAWSCEGALAKGALAISKQAERTTNLQTKRAQQMKVIDSKLPWFKLYASDFLTRTVGLTNEETGVYIKLLAYFWAYGPQPNNVDVIKSIVGGGNVELVLARYFETDQNGKLYEPLLQELRE